MIRDKIVLFVCHQLVPISYKYDPTMSMALDTAQAAACFHSARL